MNAAVLNRSEISPFEPDSPTFRYAGTELESMAFAPNYYRAIHEWFAPHLGRRVVEVGAGVGTFSKLLASDPALSELTLLEPAANNYPVLENRFAGNTRVRTRPSYLEDEAHELRSDSVVLVNVLEHIKDDAGFVAAAHQVLGPGGRLLILVPALPAIFGSLDRAFDHYRRYTRRSLAKLLGASGFEPAEIRYVNFPGTFAWLIAGRVLGRRTLGPRQVGMYDRWIVPTMLRLESRWSPPFGQSLLAIARAI